MFTVAHALCRTSLEQGLKVTLTTTGRCLGEGLLGGQEQKPKEDSSQWYSQRPFRLVSARAFPSI